MVSGGRPEEGDFMIACSMRKKQQATSNEDGSISNALLRPPTEQTTLPLKSIFS